MKGSNSSDKGFMDNSLYPWALGSLARALLFYPRPNSELTGVL